MSEQMTTGTNEAQTDIRSIGHIEVGKKMVAVTVSYLPAPSPFHRKYEEETAVGIVRTDAMAFFGVRDYKDRDTHQFFLEFEGRRLTNLAETLEQLLGPHRREAHFNLIEQVTQGAGRI
jgi:hypothetical protein